MFVKNSFEYDARVTKEAKSLVKAGHDVTVVAIHVPGKTAESETTPDGIQVVRVNRLSFGMRAALRAHARYVVGVEERHARLSGEEVDEDRLRRYTTVLPASTATPGENEVAAAATRPDLSTDEPAGPPASGMRRIWVRLSTTAMRLGSLTVRWAFRVATPQSKAAAAVLAPAET